MKTSKKIVNNLIYENIYPLKLSSLRQEGWYLGITNLCKNTYFVQHIIQYTGFNCTFYT